MNINDLNTLDNELLVIGCPLKSGIEEKMCEILIDQFIWKESFNGLMLVKTEEYDIVKSILKDNVKNYGFDLEFEKNTLSLENNSLTLINTDTTNLTFKGKSTHTYIHLFDNDLGVMKNLEKIASFSEKLWISTLDFEESIYYQVEKENTIRIIKEKNEESISKINESRALTNQEKLFYGEFKR